MPNGNDALASEEEAHQEDARRQIDEQEEARCQGAARRLEEHEEGRRQEAARQAVRRQMEKARRQKDV
jgi:hypothetical protein